MGTNPARSITFSVEALPVPKGSVQPLRSRTTGRAIVIPYRAADLKAWQSLVAYAAREAGWGTLCLGPMYVEVEFYLQRPACHYRDMDRDKPLRDDAPEWPCRKPTPDLDKLTRAIGDALQYGPYADDVQVCRWEVQKQYADECSPGALIRVSTLGGE